MNTSTLTLLFVLLPLLLSAQVTTTQITIPKRLSEVHQRGESLLLERKYKQALKYFEQALEINDQFAPSHRGAGTCYELLKDYDLAAHHYQQAVWADPNLSIALYYDLATVLYKSGEYADAMSYFVQFEGILRYRQANEYGYNGHAEYKVVQEYKARLDDDLRACRVAMDSIQFHNIEAVTNLGEAVNTAADEYFPFLTKDGETLYYTTRHDAQSDENLFRSSYRKEHWNAGAAIASFNTRNNEGMVTMVRDERTVYFTACQREGVLGPCDLWTGRLKNDKITDPQTLTGYVNSPVWESQAAVSCDGNTLYFASNRAGGHGGTDIWTAQRLPDGRWGKPSNMGPAINTPGDEEAPFITNDGNTLYFSSTGHLGMGEQDIFQSRQVQPGRWSDPVNLGPPVNSSYRELGMFLSADGKRGYFASDRAEGFGGMDIYEFELPGELYSDPVTFVRGTVRDSVYNIPVANTKVFFGDRLPVETDEYGQFFLCLPAPLKLSTQVTRYDFKPYRRTFFIGEWDNHEDFEIELLLQPIQTLQVLKGEEEKPPPSEQVFTEQILFAKNASQLNEGHLRQLYEFLENTLASGQTIKSVSIVGFADMDGSDAYNLLLSEKRAKSVALYLSDRGIRIDRVYLEGRGEVEGPDTDKRLNRRVELKVVVW